MSDQSETTIGQGQTLFRQGEKGGELFFIKSGKVELTVRNDAGESAVVAVLGTKSVLGTMSFLEGDPRSATAKALTEVKAVVVNEAQRERMLKAMPAWLGVLIKDLSTNLRRINVEYAHLKAENEVLQKRVASYKKKLGDDEEGVAKDDAAKAKK